MEQNPVTAINLPAGWLNTKTDGFEEMHMRSHDNFAREMFEMHATKKQIEACVTQYDVYEASYIWMLTHGWVRIAMEGLLASNHAKLSAVKDFVLFHLPVAYHNKYHVYLDLWLGDDMFTGHMPVETFLDLRSWRQAIRYLDAASTVW